MKIELLAWLINATVATSLVGMAIVLLRKPLQRWLGAQIAYRLWIALPLATIAAAFPPPHRADLVPAAAMPEAASTASMVVLRVSHALSGTAVDGWLLATWMVGALLLFAGLALQQRRFVARLRLRRAEDGSWRTGKADATPAVLGLWRQKLVLPEDFENTYSEEQRLLVLAHERMHQRRGDPWALAVCALLRTLFWFNPILHVAAVCFRRDVELACDAAVLRAHPQSRRRYANALLKAELSEEPLPVGCQWHLTPPMKERIMLLKQAIPSKRTRLYGALLICLVASGSTCVALAAHDPSLSAASVLAATTPSANSGPEYRVKLSMSVDGAPAGSPSLLARAGETAMVKLQENGIAWGMRFRVDRKPGTNGATLSGDVFTRDEKHVIGHAQLAETGTTPLVLSMHDKDSGRNYRIEAQVAPALAHRDAPAMAQQATAGVNRLASDEAVLATADTDRLAQVYVEGTPAPGERREIRIVRNGTPAAEIDSEDGDQAVSGDSPTPVARPEERRQIVVRAPDDSNNDTPRARSVERTVIVESGDGADAGDASDAVAPMPPMPPLPPAPPQARRKGSLRAPLAPTPPPAPMAPMAALPPLPPMAAPPVPRPPAAPSRSLARRAPTAPPSPPTPPVPPTPPTEPVAPPAPPPPPTPAGEPSAN